MVIIKMLDYLDKLHMTGRWKEDPTYVSTATTGGFEELRKNKIYKHFKKL